MLNKNELEKIVINSEEELKNYNGKNLSNKHIVLNCSRDEIKFGILENCHIEGMKIVCKKLLNCMVGSIAYVVCDEAESSVFEACYKIQCGDIDDKLNIFNNKFSHCRKIIINDGYVSDCTFQNIEIIFLTNTDMTHCNVLDVKCEKECVISMEDGELSNISFENIELKNGVYLIEGYGNPWVENSVFKNIRTSREDYEIFHMEETKGKILKKVEFSFVDEESCSGLELIQILNSINSEGESNE